MKNSWKDKGELKLKNIKIIADTSVWIEYFKGNAKIAAFLEENLLNENIYINGIIIAELLECIKTQKEAEAISSAISTVPYLETGYDNWIFSGNLSASLRKKGITLPLSNIIIAAAAIKNGMSIATLDRHFMQIQEVKLCDELI